MLKKISVLLSGLLLLAGCAGTVAPDKADTPSLSVVTTMSPLYSLTANVLDGVDSVELTNIVPPNTSVHSFTLTPEIAKRINDADIIIINGLELEEFLEDTLRETKATIVDTSVGVALKKFEEEGDHDDHDDHGHEEKDDDDHHDHYHGMYDPHIWLSPMNAKIQATTISKALEAAAPDHSKVFKKNLTALHAKLDTLYKEGKQSIAQLDIKPYVVFHDAYHYFEKDFGVKASAYLEEFPGKEPTAEYLTEVIDIIKKNNIQVIFTEPQFSPKLVHTLSNDYGLTVGELDPLGKDVSNGSYFTLIKSNIDSLKNAFTN